MRALVIGAAGFVGPFLIDELQRQGWLVTATRLPGEALDTTAEVCELDIMDIDAVATLLQKTIPDAVIHLAAQSSVSLSWDKPDLTVDINIKGTLHLLNALRDMDKPPRTLLVGSGEEYGAVPPDAIPITENTPMHPGNIYAVTKATQNMLGSLYAKAYQLPVIMSRSFNHFGPGQAPIFVASDFCKQVAEIEAGKRDAVMRVGNLQARRDFTDVRDVVRAYVLLLDKGKAGETYNIGSGKAISIQNLLDTILKLARVPVLVETAPNKLRPVDVPVIEADIRKLQEATGWAPEIALETSLEDTLTDWRESIFPF